ncbi:MAG: HDOD domain-containing protein [Planctomycetota bacterium]|jgi:putative nucleotidyltransferase with HDIG domain
MTAGGDRTIAQQVELAVVGIEDFWLLPSVAAKLFSTFFQKDPNAPLAQLIESDACLCAKTLSVLAQEGIALSELKSSLRGAIDKLNPKTIQDALLSIELAEDLQLIQIGSPTKGPSKKELALHNCAVACASAAIAETLPQSLDPQLCYMAGLLHDIGKMALAKTMPKSFLRIAEEAKSQNTSFSKTEQVHLGLDHTILGQRLARKWSLPEPVMLAIWLHHSNPQIITRKMPNAKIAQVVQVADSIARKCGLGDSGNYDSADLDESTIQSLGISEKDVEQISHELPDLVQQKCKLLGLDKPQSAATFSDVAYLSAIKLADEKNNLDRENQELRKTSGLFEFIKDFLSNIDKSSDLYRLAQRFALCWQRHYQTGPVCLYLVTASENDPLTAVVAETLSQTNILYVNGPEDSGPIPEPIANRFDIVNAHGYLDWLFNQLGVEFDYQQTKLLPLISANRTIGVLIFELRYPADIDLFRDNFQTSASIGAAILDMSIADTKRQRYAESFSQLFTIKEQETQKKAEPSQKTEPSGKLKALAEMAAGAAHELNNPLSVISGRVQLLEQTESDEEKKKTLQQIRDNAEEITRIIDDLMSFAEPGEPRPEKTDTQQLLDEAAQLAAQRAGLEMLDIEKNLQPDVKEVFIDSAQIVSSIANIFSNALESYKAKTGSIEVKVDLDDAGDSVTLQISDKGCGMDSQTLSKATHPFFSSKTAGRKRGMGLAYAQRLIELNGGRLQIQSQLDNGTTVTVTLPTQ